MSDVYKLKGIEKFDLSRFAGNGSFFFQAFMQA
jgi:hypothetical protein